MKIKSLQLKNFKRFTDLTLQDIPDNAKLILLIGSNGSGKSSLFDALEVLNRHRVRNFTSDTDKYYSKNGTPYQIVADFGNGFIEDSKVQSYKADSVIKMGVANYYGRTSFRQVPRLKRTNLGKSVDISNDSDRPYSFIDLDERFENDLEHIFGKLLKEFFRSDDDKSEIKNQIILPINQALNRIFSKDNGTKLELLELIPPLEGKVAEVNFKKGNSIFHYNQLSAGEKEIFNILINLIARKSHTGGILYFDEIDLHLNTKLQYNFIKEIVENWIPDGSQFWTASHSLGFIQYAKESEQAVIFDFDDYDFDQLKVLIPEPKDNPDIYEIAVGKDILPDLFKSYQKVFVENTDGDNYYSNLNIKEHVFIKRKDKKAIYDNVLTGDTLGLIDRDFLSDEDVSILEGSYTNLRILRFYSVENYLFHPENLLEYCKKNEIEFNQESYINEVYIEKEKIKHELFAKISDSRQTYPFGKEINPVDKTIAARFSKSAQNQEQIATINREIDSNDFNLYYKHMPMKNYLTQLSIRHKISRIELSKTDWFKQQIQKILN